ncbi:MFS transporter [Sulfitobacter sp. S190]|uniref:MFS transporter n=1 Tax=Sulfitobacter sp. S190 TaxID=2867022 RepID=UPI0021A970D1|nr:MFS transporter [Sulfitobacter sp. S190]UWR21015.1 MFS transporter [Sulfitobacter sp. S190]
MRGSWGIILALWGAGLGAAAQYAKFSVTYDQLGAVYPQAGAALGWLVSLVGLLGIILGVVAGVLVARVGYVSTLIGALWLGAAVSLAQAMLPPFGIMLGLRAIEGLSHLGLVVAAPTLIAQVATERQRGLALTLWGTFFGVAFAVLAWLGQPLARVGGVGAVFAAHGVYMAGFALVLARHLRRLQTSHRPERTSARALVARHAALYRSPQLAAPAAGWLFYTFCFVSILTVLPPYLDASLRAFIMGAMPLVSISVSMTLGVWLLRHFTAVRVVMIGFGLSAAAMGWLWVMPADPVACLAVAAAMGLIQGATFAAVPQLNTTAERQAQANGAMAQMGNLGNTLGTPVMAMALLSFGYASLPLLAGAAFLLGLCVHLWLARKRAPLA